MLSKNTNIIKLKNSINKIWVITPAYNEDYDKWKRCIKSVKSQQTNYEILHFIICDGVCQDYQKPYFFSKDPKIVIYYRNFNHGDYGDNARSFGSRLAKKYNALGICYLDIDNKLTSDHIEKNMKFHYETRSEIIISDRIIISKNKKYRKLLESKSLKFFDTNTIFLIKSSIKLGKKWSLHGKILSLIGDRIFSQHLLNSKLNIGFTQKPTVIYSHEQKPITLIKNLKEKWQSLNPYKRKKIVSMLGFDIFIK